MKNNMNRYRYYWDGVKCYSRVIVRQAPVV